MCRMLAAISGEERSPYGYLVSDECSLFRQSTAREDKLQKDGWGFAWYDGIWRIEKSPEPVFEEKDRLKALAGRKYALFVAHIRKASNPMKLPPEKLSSRENTQPFSYGKWIFAHNGQIYHPDRVKVSMGKWAEMVEGANDSEVYFWLLMKYLEEKDSVREALPAAVDHIYSIWKEVPEKDRAPAPYTALNTVLSDGRRLYAYCRYDGRGKESLCYKDRPYYQMQYLEIENGIAVSSERTSDADWRPLPDRHLLIAKRSGDFRIERLQ